MRTFTLTISPPLLLMCLLPIIISAQNLVPNSGFETFSNCPVGFSQYTGYVSTWVNPNTATPDYMNSCANPNPAGVPQNGIGYQSPHSGAAYTGMYAFSGTIYREFVQIQLTSPLIAGQQYLFSMYVVLHNKSNSAVDDIGAYLSVTPPTSTGTGMLSGSPLPQISNPSGYVITDTLNWTFISGTYTATGGERYLTLGHLKSDANTTYLSLPYGTIGAYYYYDDILLTPVTILPITLTSFTADLVPSSDHNSVQITWSTASESNSCCFIIERSNDGLYFSSIGKLTAMKNSVTPHTYTFIDEYVPYGLNYYRLIMMDDDQHFIYSQVLSIINEDFTQVHSYIINGMIHVFNEEDHAITAFLISADGRVLASQTIPPGSSDWKPPEISPGINMLVFRDDYIGNVIKVMKYYF